MQHAAFLRFCGSPEITLECRSFSSSLSSAQVAQAELAHSKFRKFQTKVISNKHERRMLRACDYMKYHPDQDTV
jgi:hypothetical protein